MNQADIVFDTIEDIGACLSHHWCPVGHGPMEFTAVYNLWTCPEKDCMFIQRIWAVEKVEEA